MGRGSGLHGRQPGIERGIRDEPSRARVIRMPLLGIWREDDRRPRVPDDVDHLQLFLAPCAERAIAKIELVAERRAEDASRSEGLAPALPRRAPRSHFSARQLADTRAEPFAHDLRQGRRAGQLDVVRVCGEKENVHRVESHNATTLNTLLSGSISSTSRSVRSLPYWRQYANQPATRSWTCRSGYSVATSSRSAA